MNIIGKGQSHIKDSFFGQKIIKIHDCVASTTASPLASSSQAKKGSAVTSSGGPTSATTNSGHNFARSIQSSLRSVSLGRNVDPPHSGTGSRGRTLLQRLAGLRRSFNSREKVHQEVPSQR